MRREQDSLNPRTHADVLLPAHSNGGQPLDHPYWYTQIIGIFHAQVIYHGPETMGARPRDMDFLFIRWLGRARNKDGSPAFGFLDPRHVIRGIHLIPAFHFNRSNNGIRKTIAQPASDNDEDWNYFEVNMFVDHYMFMRFRDGGISHKTTRDATNFFLNDWEPGFSVQDATEAEELVEFSMVFERNNPRVNLSVGDLGEDGVAGDDYRSDTSEDSTRSDTERTSKEPVQELDDEALGTEDGEEDEDEINRNGYGAL
ncbi:hypothetical protein EST38_g11125 [Candolleomyces aberdarensis]|uniref:Uncharacterized protein n=1 Tax=Candolleomyces aberdarensis TaxID=2316362 RepID=A0A4Q2D5N7_9AGAR|nr:hypothetical protein EST38_g11125 [Candolleomyces aberdarensis]